ncbi:MAG: ricin-type beta-trefoil lectin domain protein [Stellaceae bacterium]
MKSIYAVTVLAVACIVAGLGVSPARAEVMVASMAPNLCMDVNMQTNQVALWGCHGGVNQNFFTAAYGAQHFNGRCLDQASPRQGAGLVMAPCANKPSQRWSLVSDPNDHNALGSFRNESGWCANIPNGNARPGVQIIVWTCPPKNAGNRSNDVWGRGAVKPLSAVRLQPAVAQRMNTIGAIASQRGGNLVASGAGNIVASGAGNVVVVSGGALVGPSGGTFH